MLLEMNALPQGVRRPSARTGGPPHRARSPVNPWVDQSMPTPSSTSPKATVAADSLAAMPDLAVHPTNLAAVRRWHEQGCQELDRCRVAMDPLLANQPPPRDAAPAQVPHQDSLHSIPRRRQTTRPLLVSGAARRASSAAPQPPGGRLPRRGLLHLRRADAPIRMPQARRG